MLLGVLSNHNGKNSFALDVCNHCIHRALHDVRSVRAEQRTNLVHEIKSLKSTLFFHEIISSLLGFGYYYILYLSTLNILGISQSLHGGM